MSERPFQPGDRVTTDFEPRYRTLIRTVTRCYPSAPQHSSSGWLVDTAPPGAFKGLDSGWFKRAEAPPHA